MDKIIDNRISEAPEVHREFLQTSVMKLKDNDGILGVAIGGSAISNNLDEYSDLDLIVVVDHVKYQEVMKERKKIAQSIGPLLECFTGEHVGLPSLLICLYGPPLLHVDLHFKSVNDAGDRVEDPIIIWESGTALTDSLYRGKMRKVTVDLDWIENRFWVWTHYIAAKIGRGELFDVIDGMSFLRARVFGPMINLKAGVNPQGVRRIEKLGADYLESLKLTNPTHDRMNCLTAINTAIDLYRELREELYRGKKRFPSRVEREAVKYLKKIEQKIKNNT